MEQIKTVEEFIERIKNKFSVSKLDIQIKFEWNQENSIKLRYANLRSADLRSANLSSANLSSADLRFADLSSADLSSADLSSADLRFAEGEFIFNFGVKLKVVN